MNNVLFLLAIIDICLGMIFYLAGFRTKGILMLVAAFCLSFGIRNEQPDKEDTDETTKE